MDYIERLLLLDAVDYLSDRLDSLRDEEEITAAAYNRKKAYRGLIRAVNNADRYIASLNRRTKTVCLFVPKDMHVLPLSVHADFSAEQAAGVTDSTLATLHPAAIDVFVNEEPWTEIVGIFSEIFVYEKHLVDGGPPTAADLNVLRRRNVLRNATQSGFPLQAYKTFWFDTKNRILHLSEPLAEDSFLVFEAYTVPGTLDIRQYSVNDRSSAEETELVDYRLDTPTIYEELLMDVAMGKLLPRVSKLPTPAEVMEFMQGLEPGNGPAMYCMPGNSVYE